MSDCRILTDAKGDLRALQGGLITGSTAIDVVGARFTQGTDSWTLAVETAATTQQNPVGGVTVGLYLDVDGRTDNNAPTALRLGADTVYALVYQNGAWRVTKEEFSNNGWRVVTTKASYSVTDAGYSIVVPYAEVSKEAHAYWRAGVAVSSGTNTTADFAPDSGLSCAPTLGVQDSAVITDIPTAGRTFTTTDVLAKYVAGLIVIAVIAVILWKRFKKKST